jgi:hypothetical protein
VVLNGDTDGDLRAVPGADSPGLTADASAGAQFRRTDLAELSTPELADTARRLLDVLARRSDETAFAELLGLYETLGTALGESARNLAQETSWAQVATAASVNRSPARDRWRR